MIHHVTLTPSLSSSLLPSLSLLSTALALLLARQTDRRATLSSHTKRTLGSGNLRAAVKVPDGEDRNEWIAVSVGLGWHPCHLIVLTVTLLSLRLWCWQANTVDFYNELSLLYGLCAEDGRCHRVATMTLAVIDHSLLTYI